MVFSLLHVRDDIPITQKASSYTYNLKEYTVESEESLDGLQLFPPVTESFFEILDSPIKISERPDKFLFEMRFVL